VTGRHVNRYTTGPRINSRWLLVHDTMDFRPMQLFFWTFLWIFY